MILGRFQPVTRPPGARSVRFWRFFDQRTGDRRSVAERVNVWWRMPAGSGGFGSCGYLSGTYGVVAGGVTSSRCFGPSRTVEMNTPRATQAAALMSIGLQANPELLIFEMLRHANDAMMSSQHQSRM